MRFESCFNSADTVDQGFMKLFEHRSKVTNAEVVWQSLLTKSYKHKVEQWNYNGITLKVTADKHKTKSRTTSNMDKMIQIINKKWHATASKEEGVNPWGRKYSSKSSREGSIPQPRQLDWYPGMRMEKWSSDLIRQTGCRILMTIWSHLTCVLKLTKASLADMWHQN